MTKTHILIFAAVLFLAHAVEECLWGFDRTDTIIQWVSNAVSIPTVAVWLVVQVVVFIFLLVIYLFQDNPKTKVLWLVLFIITLVELSHPFSALTHQAYTPGLITSLLFIPLGWLVYKQLRRS